MVLPISLNCFKRWLNLSTCILSDLSTRSSQWYCSFNLALLRCFRLHLNQIIHYRYTHPRSPNYSFLLLTDLQWRWKKGTSRNRLLLPICLPRLLAEVLCLITVYASGEMLLILPHWAVKFAFKGSGKSSFGPLCPGQCIAQMYVCVSGNLIDDKIFTGTSINPALTAFDSLPWLPKGYKLNIFIPNSSISFRDLCSLPGYLESLLHVPQQQCLVLTILSEIKRL